MLKYIALIGLLLSCAQVKKAPNVKRSNNPATLACYSKHDDFDSNNLIQVAQIKSSHLTSCFKNYLRFEINKKQTLSVCNQLVIKRNGKVSYVQVNDLYRKNLPKDFVMCVKQEFWKMNFSALDLRRSHSIRFPLVFKSK